MVFLLRAAEAPVRTLRETDEAGVERTFWLFADETWIVCAHLPDGAVIASCAPELSTALSDGGSVTVVEVTPVAPVHLETEAVSRERAHG